MPKLKLKRLKRCAGQHRQVPRPHLAIVVPGLVLHVAREQPRDAADNIRGTLRHHRRQSQRRPGVRRIPHAVGEFEQRVHQPARILPRSQQHVAPSNFGRPQRERLRHRRRASLAIARRDDTQIAGARLRDAIHHARLNAARAERPGQFPGRPSGRRCRRHRIARIEHNGDRARGCARKTGGRRSTQGSGPKKLCVRLKVGGIHNKSRFSRALKTEASKPTAPGASSARCYSVRTPA